jgi:hypothetical protein
MAVWWYINGAGINNYENQKKLLGNVDVTDMMHGDDDTSVYSEFARQLSLDQQLQSHTSSSNTSTSSTSTSTSASTSASLTDLSLAYLSSHIGPSAAIIPRHSRASKVTGGYTVQQYLKLRYSSLEMGTRAGGVSMKHLGLSYRDGLVRGSVLSLLYTVLSGVPAINRRNHPITTLQEKFPGVFQNPDSIPDTTYSTYNMTRMADNTLINTIPTDHHDYPGNVRIGVAVQSKPMSNAEHLHITGKNNHLPIISIDDDDNSTQSNSNRVNIHLNHSITNTSTSTSASASASAFSSPSASIPSRSSAIPTVSSVIPTVSSIFSQQQPQHTHIHTQSQHHHSQPQPQHSQQQQRTRPHTSHPPSQQQQQQQQQQPASTSTTPSTSAAAAAAAIRRARMQALAPQAHKHSQEQQHVQQQQHQQHQQQSRYDMSDAAITPPQSNSVPVPASVPASASASASASMGISRSVSSNMSDDVIIVSSNISNNNSNSNSIHNHNNSNNNSTLHLPITLPRGETDVLTLVETEDQSSMTRALIQVLKKNNYTGANYDVFAVDMNRQQRTIKLGNPNKVSKKTIAMLQLRGCSISVSSKG